MHRKTTIPWTLSSPSSAAARSAIPIARAAMPKPWSPRGKHSATEPPHLPAKRASFPTTIGPPSPPAPAAARSSPSATAPPARLYPADATLATSTSPLITELRERLTAALTTGSTDLAGKLLALDTAGNFLPPTEHLAWTRDAAVLSNAATLLAADQRAAARTAYLQAVRHLADPALGEFAARTARDLRNAVPAKAP